jgi:hypothetical protein
VKEALSRSSSLVSFSLSFITPAMICEQFYVGDYMAMPAALPQYFNPREARTLVHSGSSLWLQQLAQHLLVIQELFLLLNESLRYCFAYIKSEEIEVQEG